MLSLAVWMASSSGIPASGPAPRAEPGGAEKLEGLEGGATLMRRDVDAGARSCIDDAKQMPTPGTIGVLTPPGPLLDSGTQVGSTSGMMSLLARDLAGEMFLLLKAGDMLLSRAGMQLLALGSPLELMGAVDILRSTGFGDNAPVGAAGLTGGAKGTDGVAATEGTDERSGLGACVGSAAVVGFDAVTIGGVLTAGTPDSVGFCAA